MSKWLIAFVGVIYLYISIEQVFKGNTPMSTVYFGYALANVGLYFSAS